MRKINPSTTALSVGLILGLWHSMWVILVGLGLAKPLLDFILQLHFIEVQYQLAPYAALTALMLVAVTFAVGFVFGFLFAVIWNSLAREEREIAPAATRGRAATS